MKRYVLLFIGCAIGIVLVNVFKGQPFDREDTAYLFGVFAAYIAHWLASIGS
jgi:hypothetical protein